MLVDRYVRLIEAGVDPRHILAMTFTRKAAAEMRDRVLALLRRRADEGALPATRWRHLRDHVGDIQISTIDAFCFGLLHEFPLEADVDPGFEIADETEMARFSNEALDLTLQAARGLMKDDESVRLLFAGQTARPARSDRRAPRSASRPRCRRWPISSGGRQRRLPRPPRAGVRQPAPRSARGTAGAGGPRERRTDPVAEPAAR